MPVLRLQGLVLVTVLGVITKLLILIHPSQSATVDTTPVARDTHYDDERIHSFKRDNNQHQHRERRTIYKATGLYTNGIVPYQYKSEVNQRQRGIIQKVMEHYQNLSCIRFVPRVSSDGKWAKDVYNLDHGGYIQFVQKKQCFGGVGNNGGASLVSCCERDSCIHEIGHTLGLIHEHQNPGSIGFLLINYDKIKQAKKVRYKIAKESEIVEGFPFDVSSPMAYPYRADVTVLIPDVSLETKDFYMFQEISDVYKCPQNNCSHFKTKCVNDGYVTMVQGVCACRCPEGLNPQTGCATVLSQDRESKRCGTVYELNALKTSRNFFKIKRQTKECSWLFNAPEGDTITVEFFYFNFPMRSRRECADEIEIRMGRIGQGGKRFCGTKPPVMIRSYFNRLMVTYRPGKESTVQSALSATVRLVSADSLCYNTSDKGFTYRGNVNYDRNYVKCVDWSTAVNCPHNPYRFSDMSAGLDSNFCRNPGDGTRPWCYVFAHTCRRMYCDVCNVEPLFDKDTPGTCRAMKSSFYNLCRFSKDEAQKLRCAKTCKEEILSKPKRASTVTCPRPPSMRSSQQVDKQNQDSFTVGESVTFRCIHPDKRSQTELKRYCLTNGKWSEGETACLPCHREKGYVLYLENCYNIETEQKSAGEHQAVCRSFGGDLADVKTLEEQKFITDLGFKRGASSLYIGVNDIAEEGAFRYRDNTPVTWAPWHSTHKNTPSEDCVTSTPNNEWYANSCNVRKQAVCKGGLLNRENISQCSDARGDCGKLLALDAEMCTRDYGSFAFTQCAKTCSKCIKS